MGGGWGGRDGRVPYVWGLSGLHLLMHPTSVCRCIDVTDLVYGVLTSAVCRYACHASIQGHMMFAILCAHKHHALTSILCSYGGHLLSPLSILPRSVSVNHLILSLMLSLWRGHWDWG
ncbi:unnamed protein product [Discosporangium mesarthrocarpum]